MFKTLVGVSVCVAALATGVHATSFSDSIEDLATGSLPTSSTFAGQGYVGTNPVSFNTIIEAEIYSSTTLMQVDFSAPLGVRINSASLIFKVTSGGGGAACFGSTANRSTDAERARLVASLFSTRCVVVASEPCPAGLPLLGAGLLAFGVR